MEKKAAVFSRNVRSLRIAAGYTQDDISALLHVARQTYSNYENLTRQPSIDIIINLAAILHVTIDALLLDNSLSDSKQS